MKQSELSISRFICLAYAKTSGDERQNFPFFFFEDDQLYPGAGYHELKVF